MESFWYVTHPGKAGQLREFRGWVSLVVCSLVWCFISEMKPASWDVSMNALALWLLWGLLLLSSLFSLTQRTKANGFVYAQRSLLCFLSIVQVPRITSLFPRMTFRPLFSTMQTASLLSSHPVEAAMCGVAGAMYYLCERAFASRWKPTKVCLFLLALEITFTSMFPPRRALSKLWQELKAQAGTLHLIDSDFNVCRMFVCLQSPHGEKKSILKGQQTKNATSQDYQWDRP